MTAAATAPPDRGWEIHEPDDGLRIQATPATTFPRVNTEQAERIRRISERRAKLDDQWRAEIIAAVAAGASLREVAEVAGISHTAVKFIAHGRPPRAT